MENEEIIKEENEIIIPNISINLEIEKEFSYVLYHTDARLKIETYTKLTSYSFIRALSIKNNTDLEYTNLTLELSFSNKAFHTYDMHINSINKNEEKDLSIPFIIVDNKMLEDIVEPTPAFIKVILKNNELIINELEIPFNILPISQLRLDANESFDYRLFAKLITPNCNKVKQITIDSEAILDRSIIAYQNRDRNKRLEEVESIYKALHNYGIIYQNPPAKRYDIQRVRMPYEVLNDRKGTCLDLSILYAACLEEVGFNPIVLFLDTHALVGLFLDDIEDDKNNEISTVTFENGIEKRIDVIRNLLDEKIILIDAVCLVSNNETSFMGALDSAKKYILMNNDSNFSAIDVKTCHLSAFSPIPSNGLSDELINRIDPKTLIERESKELSNEKYVNVLKKEEKTRFTFWERKLLDLSELNPLVNIKTDIEKCVRLISENPIYEAIFNSDVLELSCDFLTKAKGKDSGLKSDTFQYIVSNPETKPSFFNPLISNKDQLFAIGYERVLDMMIKKSNDSMDETGAQTLYICFGLVSYRRKNGKMGDAPFIVLPIEKLTKSKVGNKYYISIDSSEFMINQTFFEYYKNENPGADFSELYSCKAEDGYMNIVNTFKANSNLRLDHNQVFITNLTFSHYIMWNDIRKRKEELRKNKIVLSIIENKNLLDEKLEYQNKKIDDIEKYQDFAAPLPYDSTQLKAILESGNGKSFILDGPPGTGKSQTIVNMIVNAFYHGKTVLFVAEKKAALDVVYDRLEKIKLSRFALELHSNKANKDTFYNKIAESMDMGPTVSPFEFNVNCIDLENSRDNLRKIIEEMHSNDTYIYSLYDAIVAYERLKANGYEYYINLDEAYLKSLDNDTFNKVNVLIDKYNALSKSIDDYNSNPLRFLGIYNIRFSDKSLILKELNQNKELFEAFINDYNNISNIIELDIERTNKNIDSIITNLDLILNKELYLDNIYSFGNKDTNYKVANLFELTHKLNDFINKNKDIYNFDYFKGIDSKKLFEEYKGLNGFFNKFKYNLKLKKLLKNALKTKFNKKNISTYLEDISFYNEYIGYVIEDNELISKLIGIDFISNISNLDSIEAKYNNSVLFIDNVKNIESYMSFDLIIKKLIDLKDDSRLKLLFNEMIKKYLAFKEYEYEIINKKYLLNYKMMELSNPYDRYIEFINYSSKEDNFNELINIASINLVVNELNVYGMDEFIIELKNNKFELDEFKDVYELSIVNGLLGLYFKNDDINYFNSESFQYEIEKYRGYIKKYSDYVIEEVSARLSKKLDYNSIDYKSSSNIGQLKKIFSMKRNKPSIRETLIKYNDIIKDFFPCFLMSPLSAAQYLSMDDETKKFDIVIFDEASQIPTHEAIGPIARGNSLIVSGDPKQMPPSKYFNSDIIMSEDDLEFEDSASLLDECLAIDLPRIRLQYHYRSKHESLISFSNQNFYKNSLYTFPSTSCKDSEVIFNYVNLDSNKKNSQMSKDELEAIWHQVEIIYTNKETKEQSVGIIVFNVIQKEAVESFINKKLNENKTIKEALMKATEITKEPLFVKSLENVQGDERDIIILSIGFRLTNLGHPNVNGPLAAANGERRLNVAASRAKRKMILVSTIKYLDFDTDENLARNKNNGALYLKRLIGYAKNSNYINQDKENDSNVSIVNFIKSDLEALGYNVKTNVGLSNYKVDIAIKSKDNSNYLLGVLIDDRNVSDITSIRDELYLTESFLTSALDWNIINIYTVEYFKNPKKVIDYIVSNIGQDIKKVKTYDIDPNIVKEEKHEFKYNTVAYNYVSNLIPLSYSNEFGFRVFDLRTNLQNIIDVEGPVSYNIIKDYIVKNTNNITKASAKFDKFLRNELNYVFTDTTIDLDEKGKPIEFFWPKGMNYNLSFFRISSRDINDIPKEELAAAMKQILKLQGKISLNDLFKATLEVFNMDLKLNQKVKSKLNQAYKFGFEKGFLEALDND